MTDPTTAEDRTARLAEIRARLDAATEGPWKALSYDDYPGDEGSAITTGIGMDQRAIAYSIPYPWHDQEATERDAELIAHAPADLAWLLSELEAAQARLDAAAKVHKPVEGFSRMCGTTYLWCAECSDCGGDGSRGHIMWPCDTAKALGLGEEAGQ